MGRIGVLALQGGVAAHLRVLERLGHRALEVRSADQLDGLEGLVLPGGESSVQWRLIERHHLASALEAHVAKSLPLLATCAGLILAARTVVNPQQRSFGWLNLTVARNAWGRQLDSFESRDDEDRHPLVFIRAPRVVEVGEGVEVLATLLGEPVWVRQGQVFAATFHPELTADVSVHQRVFGSAKDTRPGPRSPAC